MGTLKANEADTALEELAVQLAEYKPFVANRKEAEERYLADAKEKEVRYMAERDQLKVRERELEARRQDNESVVSTLYLDRHQRLPSKLIRRFIPSEKKALWVGLKRLAGVSH